MVRPFAPMAPTLRGSLEAPEITPDKANRPLNPISNRFSNRRVLKVWRMSFQLKRDRQKLGGLLTVLSATLKIGKHALGRCAGVASALKHRPQLLLSIAARDWRGSGCRRGGPYRFLYIVREATALLYAPVGYRFNSG